MVKNYFIKVLLVVFFWVPYLAFSANKTFTGPGNFSDATKWSGGTLPLAGDNLTIDGTCVFDDTRGLTYTRLNLGNPNPSGTVTWPVGSTNNLIVDRIVMNNNTSRIDMTNGGILTVKMNWNMGGSSALISGMGTVIFQTASLTLPAQLTNFYNLSIQTGAGSTITLSGATTVRGNLFISSGNLDVSASNFSLTIGRNFTNNGTLVQRAGTITFNGALAQLISGTTTTTFNNLVINSISVTLLRSISVNGVLSFLNGRINTAANIVTINSTGSVAGAAAGRYVNGFLRKSIATGTNVTSLFEIGNNTTYNPVSITFATVSAGGTLTARERTGEHPSIGSSCIDPLKGVNYYWSLTSAGLAFTTYNATVTFTSTDYDAGSNPMLFGLQSFNASWSIPLTTTGTATTSTAAGFTVLGDLAAGESKTPASVSVLASPGTTVCPGTAVTFTATPLNGGPTPVYQWLKNGTIVGGNSTSYIDSTLNSADSIRVILTSNNSCVFAKTVSSVPTFITPIIGVWRGVTSTSWSTGTNWCGNVVPASTDNIVINSGAPNMPSITGNTACNNLTLTAGATLTITGFSFTVNGSFTGQGQITGGTTSSLTINGSGVTSPLNMTQTTRATRTLQNLTINSPSSTITMGDSLLLTGTLTLSNGILNTSGLLRLLSLPGGTARIGTITGGNINGSVTMERYLPAGSGWHLLSSPVTGCTLNDWSDDFIMGGFPGSPYPTVTNSSILTYNESTAGVYDYGYEIPTGISNAISANKGYWAYIINTPLTIDVTGPVLKGDQTVSLSYTNNDAATEIGWNLIANPYPSALDWDSPLFTKTNVDPAVYLFNGSSEQYTTYVGGIGINGGSRYIPSSQGILIQATGPGASITFRETVKSTQDPAFMKMQSINVPVNLLRLKVTGSSGSDETVIRFDNNATSSYDQGLDATKLINWDANAPAICSVTGQNYSINALPGLTQSYSIPLRVVVMSSGTYTIKLDQHYQLPSTSCITLEDKLTGIKKNFSTDSTYTFSISDTTWAPRFLLHISRPVEFVTKNEVCANGRIIAALPSASTYSVTWKDSSNTVIRQVSNAQFADTLSGVSKGTYRFSVSGNAQQCPVLSDTVSVGRDSLQYSCTGTMPSCRETTDGSIHLACSPDANLNVTVSDGNMILFSGNINSPITVAGLDAGSYSVAWSNSCVSGTSAINLTPQYGVTADYLATSDTVNLNGSITFINNSSGAGLFFWDFGDGTFDYSNDPVHVYSAPGIYQVSLIASNSFCSDTVIKTIYVIPNTVRYFNDPSIKMYLRDQQTLIITMTAEPATNASVSVFDMEGKRVAHAADAYGRNIEMTLPELSSGIYSVILTNNGSVKNSRFVITK